MAADPLRDLLPDDVADGVPELDCLLVEGEEDYAFGIAMAIWQEAVEEMAGEDEVSGRRHREPQSK